MPSDPYGLDKAARLAGQAAADAAAAIPEALDPPFPFIAEPFDFAFFNIPANPVPPPAPAASAA